MPEWISVKERLPENDDWVLIWYRDKDGDYYPTVGRFKENGCWSTDVDANDFAYPPEEITHWMPIPEPPVMEKS